MNGAPTRPRAIAGLHTFPESLPIRRADPDVAAFTRWEC